MYKNHKIGKIGENTACRFLMKHGYSVVKRNYLKKWGEIDIIATKAGNLYFVEVKTVSCEIDPNTKKVFSHETGDYRAEDNVHPAKIKRLHRAINSYLIENDVPHETQWQLNVVAVYLDLSRKLAKIEQITDIVL